MKRDSLQRLLAPVLLMSLAALGGCRSLKKQTAEAEPEAAVAEAAAEPATGPVEEPAEFAGLSRPEQAFILACRQAASQGTGPRVAGREGFVFSRSELAELGANRTADSARHRTLVGTLAAYAARLKAAGTEFVLLPVPPKAVIYPDRLPADPAVANERHDSYLRALYAELEKSGVTVVDPTEELRDDRFSRRGPAFPAADTLWTPLASASAAETVRKALRRSEPVRGLSRRKDIDASTADLAAAGAKMRVRSVTLKTPEGKIPLPEPASGQAPVIVVGDAQAMAYHAGGFPEGFDGSLAAGFADQLAAELAVPVELRADPRLGWKQASAKYPPGSVPDARLVVWCLSATTFLEDGGTTAGSPQRPPRRSAPAPATGALQLRDPSVEMRAD